MMFSILAFESDQRLKTVYYKTDVAKLLGKISRLVNESKVLTRGS